MDHPLIGIVEFAALIGRSPTFARQIIRDAGLPIADKKSGAHQYGRHELLAVLAAHAASRRTDPIPDPPSGRKADQLDPAAVATLYLSQDMTTNALAAQLGTNQVTVKNVLLHGLIWHYGYTPATAGTLASKRRIAAMRDVTAPLCTGCELRLDHPGVPAGDNNGRCGWCVAEQAGLKTRQVELMSYASPARGAQIKRAASRH